MMKNISSIFSMGFMNGNKYTGAMHLQYIFKFIILQILCGDAANKK